MKLRKMMFFLLTLIFMIGCGEQQAKDENSETISKGFSLRFATSCQNGMISSENIKNIANLNIKIKSIKGEEIFNKTLTQSDFSASTTISGIPNAVGATVIISGFAQGNNNTPAWQGTVTGMTFKKGNTTNISVVLYPTNSKDVCLPTTLSEPRFAHTTTLLPDGRILVAGGFSTCTGTECNATKSVEIIDPETGKVEKLADLMTPRAFQTAIPLPDGTILFLGGVKSLTMNKKQQIKDFPELPFTLSSVATGIEKYNPGYPKTNKALNNIGQKIPNTADFVKTTGNFYPYQRILPLKTSKTSWKVYLVGGVDSNNEAIAKVYSFTIDASKSPAEISDMQEESIADLPATILPLVSQTQTGALFVLGGMKDSSTVSGIIDSNKFTKMENDKLLNIYFPSIVTVDNAVYSFGGMIPNSENQLEETGKILKITPDTQEVVSGKFMVATSIFQDVVYNKFSKTFIAIGGTLSILNDWKDWRKKDTTQPRGTAHNFVRTFDQNLTAQTKINTFYMNFDRLLSKSVITNNGLMFITGGITGFNDTGKLVKYIEVKKVK